MGSQHHYQPCFASIPESSRDRWTILRQFVSRWHDIPLSLERDPQRAARDIEDSLNQTLPAAIREWIAFSVDLIAINAFEQVMRDVFAVSCMEQFSCTTLMLQGEDDVLWMVSDKNADLADPPVDSLHRNVDTNAWVEGWNESRSLTSFVLGHMAYFLGPGFTRTKGIDDSVIAEMNSEFQIAVDFDGLRVYEMQDMIVFIRPSVGRNTLTVAHRASLKESQWPDCVRRLASLCR